MNEYTIITEAQITEIVKVENTADLDRITAELEKRIDADDVVIKRQKVFIRGCA